MSQFLVESAESWIVLCQEETTEATNQPKPYGNRTLGFPSLPVSVLADVENLSLAHKMQISPFDQFLAVEIPNPSQEEQKDQHSSMASCRWHTKDKQLSDRQVAGLTILMLLQKTHGNFCHQNQRKRRHFRRHELKMRVEKS